MERELLDSLDMFTNHKLNISGSLTLVTSISKKKLRLNTHSHTPTHMHTGVIAVVSAMSGTIKADGTTSRLLSAAQNSIDQKCFEEDLRKIEDLHMEIVYGGFQKPQVRESARNVVFEEIKELRRFLESLRVIREISGRSLDRIVGCGERLSANLVSASLNDKDIPSFPVDLSNLVDSVDVGKAGYRNDLIRAVKSEMETRLSEDNENAVPVLTGFFGHVEGGILDGVGRGYTDLTSAITASALSADSLQVWKESDGVFTGNPTKIDTARLVSHVSPREAAELTYFGNEVLHPYTMETAIEAKIPVQILNTFKPDGKGTVVDPNRYTSLCSDEATGGVNDSPATAVCSKKNVCLLNLTSNRKLGSFKFLSRVFEVFMRHEVKVDLVSTTEVSLSVTINESTPVELVERAMQELEAFGECDLKTDRAIVSLIGEGMRKTRGMAAEMFSTLADQNVNIEMIAQGSSEVNISVVVGADDAELAVKSLHTNFFERGSDVDECVGA